MNYDDAIHYLFTAAPMFQKIGAGAYKPGLGNIEVLDRFFNYPSRSFPTIHIAGTNGKGSVSHTLAAIYQSEGYKTGLFTSPHLLDFRERIRVNGEVVDRSFVTQFIEQHKMFFETVHPSFFEITTIMAFCYFSMQQVDIAIIETGMGGRLDSSNIITPLISIITNISRDHMQFLGNTLSDIAKEKAGIIKEHIPVVIGEGLNSEVEQVFRDTAKEKNAPLYFAENSHADLKWEFGTTNICYRTHGYTPFEGALKGYAQPQNTRTILTALDVLKENTSLPISEKSIYNGFAQVDKLTGLMGRWQTFYKNNIRIVADTGHNEAGMEYNMMQLSREKYVTLHIIIGMVKDKEIDHILPLLPANACYYFVNPDIPRALNSHQLQQTAQTYRLKGDCYHSVKEGLETAISNATSNDLLFVGGSNFVVAEALPLLLNQ